MTGSRGAIRSVLVLTCAAGVALMLATAGCSVASAPPPQSRATVAYSAPTTSDSPGLSGAAAVNAFGLDLIKQQSLRAAANPSGNEVVSPLSVHAALSMTLQGAAGDTAAEMRRTLHLSGDVTAAASTYRILLDTLSHRSARQKLEVANALWIDSALKVKPEFLNANRISFGASARTLDFSQTDLVAVVNAWAADKTHGMIDQAIDRVPTGTVIVLVDAIYFKGTWAQPFPTWATRPQSFRFESGQARDVSTMHETASLPVVREPGFSATRLQYSGGDSVAYLLLPDTGHSLDEVLGGLTPARFAEMGARLDSAMPTSTARALPRFDAMLKSELSTPLASMGMPSAFVPGAADFTAMATRAPGDEPIFIAAVDHTARMSVQETGTEAAASTEVFGAAGGRSVQPKPVPFVCDHPFAMAIVDKPSGALLFIAAVRDPSAK